MSIGTVQLPGLGAVALAASTHGICAMAFLDHHDHISREPPAGSATILRQGLRELQEFAQGKRREFSVPVDLSACTTFTQAVLAACAKIPFGQVRTYGEIARAVGRPGGAQAVGQALGRNPLAIIVPCHRVVSGNGDGGFTAGMHLKYVLWELEHIPRRSAGVIPHPRVRTD